MVGRILFALATLCVLYTAEAQLEQAELHLRSSGGAVRFGENFDVSVSRGGVGVMKLDAEFVQMNTSDVRISGSAAERLNSTSLVSLLERMNKAIEECHARAQKNVLPLSTILPYTGAIADIPQGWFVCDGSQGTVDLRDRFVVGSGPQHGGVGATGGSRTVTLNTNHMPAHGHPLNGGIASSDHSHSGTTAGGNPMAYQAVQATGTETFNAVVVGHTSNQGANANRNDANYMMAAHTHSFSVGGGSHSHGHSFSVGNSGSGTAFNTEPPFFSLLYIQKMFD